MLRKFKKLLLVSVVIITTTVFVSVASSLFHQSRQVYEFQVIGPIEDVLKYKLKFYSLLLETVIDNNDTVIITINSPGGLTVPTLNFIHELNMTDARVIGIVDNLAASAGAYIFGSCPEVIFSDKSIFLVHVPRLFNDKTKEVIMLPKNDKILIASINLIKVTWFDIMTEQEQQDF